MLDVSEVLKDLCTLQSMKELSYGEKKMLEKAKDLIVSEISAARSTSEEQISAEVDKHLAAAQTEFSTPQN